MKKAIVLVAILLVPAITLAENPDSRPSIFFGLGGDLRSGKSSKLGFNQDHDGQDIGFGASMRWPASENVTFQFGLGFSTGKTRWEENIFYYAQTTDYTRFDFSFGIRFYIGQSINK